MEGAHPAIMKKLMETNLEKTVGYGQDPYTEDAKEKIRKAQELAKNAKPGSLTSKANLVNKYNSGVKTEEVIPEKQDNKKKK